MQRGRCWSNCEKATLIWSSKSKISCLDHADFVLPLSTMCRPFPGSLVAQHLCEPLLCLFDQRGIICVGLHGLFQDQSENLRSSSPSGVGLSKSNSSPRRLAKNATSCHTGQQPLVLPPLASPSCLSPSGCTDVAGV